MKVKNALYKLFAVLLALCAWQAAACYVGYSILLPAPKHVFASLLRLFKDDSFFSAITYSFGKIISGFLWGSLLGTIFGILSGKFKLIETLLWPYMITIKSIPVASFTIVALIWLTSDELSTFVSFLMVTPIVYTNVLQGYKSIDSKLIQMANIFKMPFYKRLLYITVPGLKPFILSACSVAFGLAWKSGVAAELIGLSDNSIGGKLYYTKLNFMTDDLFAWTFVIIVISVFFEKLFIALLKCMFKGVEKL